MNSNIEFITYGFFVNLDRINPLVKNNSRYYLNKPNSGLWGSPIDSKWGWKDWCEREGFRGESFKIYTKWKLKSQTKILVIDSSNDFISIMDRYKISEINPILSRYYLDFYKMAEDGYSGIYLTEKGNRECHYGVEYKDGNIDLNPWDCESIVVWDKNKIKITEKGRII